MTQRPRTDTSSPDLRENLLAGACLLGVAVVFLTEFLSLLHKLDRFWITLSWTAAAALCILMICFRRMRDRPLPSVPKELSEKLFYCAAGLWLAITLVIAIAAAPNNYDSMTYHLPRVMHWIQNAGVRHYPTSNLRQLIQPPLCEYFILHLMLLCGSDRLANLPQWFCYGGILVTASAIASELGLARKSQILSALFCLTLPSVILQSTCTQNDLMTAFWFSCFVYFSLRLSKVPGAGYSCLSAAALGLAMATKFTSYFYAVPFIVWLLAIQLPRGAFRGLALWISIIAAINAGFLARNYACFSSAFGPVSIGSDRYLSESFGPATVLSTLVRNAALHLQSPWPALTQALTGAIERTHQWFGINPSDPASTIHTRFFISPQINFEDTAGNPLHAMILAALAALFVIRIKNFDATLRHYFLAGLAAFFVFCLCLKWQVWNTRLHLTLFVLAAPWAAAVMTRLFSRAVIIVIILALTISSCYWLTNNLTRPLFGPSSVVTIPRQRTMFAANPMAEDDFIKIADLLAKTRVTSVGISFGENDWEYPLWALDRRGLTNRALKFCYQNVDNTSQALASEADHPQARLYSMNFLKQHRERLDRYLSNSRIVAMRYYVLAFDKGDSA